MNINRYQGTQKWGKAAQIDNLSTIDGPQRRNQFTTIASASQPVSGLADENKPIFSSHRFRQPKVDVQKLSIAQHRTAAMHIPSRNNMQSRQITMVWRVLPLMPHSSKEFPGDSQASFSMTTIVLLAMILYAIKFNIPQPVGLKSKGSWTLTEAPDFYVAPVLNSYDQIVQHATLPVRAQCTAFVRDDGQCAISNRRQHKSSQPY